MGILGSRCNFITKFIAIAQVLIDTSQAIHKNWRQYISQKGLLKSITLIVSNSSYASGEIRNSGIIDGQFFYTSLIIL